MTSTWTENIIERYCVLTEDAGAGKPVQLMDWQRGLIRDAEGKRMVWLEIPRKNGKSAFIAMLAIAHLLKGFKDGTNPQVILAAATREQAGILFGYVRNMILLNPQLQKVLEPFRKEIRLKGKPGYLKTITSDGGSNHGLNPSLILCDEIHSWNEVKGPELWEALRTSMAARPSQMIAITTAGSAYSFAHKWHEYAQRVAEQPEIDPSWLTIIYKRQVPVGHYKTGDRAGEVKHNRVGEYRGIACLLLCKQDRRLNCRILALVLAYQSYNKNTNRCIRRCW